MFYKYVPKRGSHTAIKNSLYLTPGDVVTVAEVPQNITLSDGFVFVQSEKTGIIGPVSINDLKIAPMPIEKKTKKKK